MTWRWVETTTATAKIANTSITPTVKWPPLQYAKWLLLKFRLGTSVLPPPRLNNIPSWISTTISRIFPSFASANTALSWSLAEKRIRSVTKVETSFFLSVNATSVYFSFDLKLPMFLTLPPFNPHRFFRKRPNVTKKSDKQKSVITIKSISLSFESTRQAQTIWSVNYPPTKAWQLPFINIVQAIRHGQKGTRA